MVPRSDDPCWNQEAESLGMLRATMLTLLFLRSRCRIFRHRKRKQTHLDAMFECGLHTGAKLFVGKRRNPGSQ